MRSVAGLLAALSLFFGVSHATPSIFVAYPSNHHRVKHTHVIVEGSVTAGARLRISGKPVPVGSDGLFMLWWPLQEGLNRLDMLATRHGQSKRKTLHITRVVPRPLAATPTRIRANSVRPHQALEFWNPAADSLQEREVTFRFEGSRAGRAQLQIGDMSPQAMPEISAGVYSKTLTIPAISAATHGTTHNPWRAAPVRFYLTGQDGKTLSATASTISVLPEIGPRLGTQKADSIEGLGVNSALSRVLDLDGRPLLYPAANTQYKVVGREGEFFRVRLQKGQSGLVASQHIDLATVPPKTLSGGVVEIEEGEEGAGHVIRLRVGVHGGKAPFRVQQLEPQKLLLTLYGLERAPVLGIPLDGSLGTDVLHRLGLRSVRVKQEQTEHQQTEHQPAEHQILIELTSPQLWGFYAHYADQNTADHSATNHGTRASDDILLTLRTSAPTPTTSTLSGRVITIDAGHGGIHKGGAGSLRVPEKGLVLPIALQVAEKLRKWGATVHLTRTEDVTLGLYERVLLAEQTQSELLVSLHANALPDGVDPRGIRGPEVYFSHEQARPAAAAILQQLRLGLPEIGHGKGLRPNADFALTRPTAQISLLVELGYLTDPQNLRTLHSASGQARFAEAVALGIRDFFEAASQGSHQDF